MQRFFQAEGYDAEIRRKDRDGRTLHIVWVGSFATLEEARKLTQHLQARYNISSFVVTR